MAVKPIPTRITTLPEGHPFKAEVIIFGSTIPESYKKRMAAQKKEQSESSTITSPEVSEESKER